MPDRAVGAALPADRARLSLLRTGTDTGRVIHEVDSALRTLIERDTGIRDVEVVFDAPTREWAGRRTTPTVDVYLYDIREDLRLRSRGVINGYDDRARVVSRHLPPRYFKLSYLVTAWTQRPEDEHQMLSSLLATFLRYDALPAEVLAGPLSELGLPVPVTIGLPPPEDRGFADVWSALGGELKPSIDVVVVTPVETGQQYPVGPAVTEPPLFDFADTVDPERGERVGFDLAEPRPKAGRGKRGRAPAEEETEEVPGTRVSMRRRRFPITRTS